jgi:hypothetical protein
MVHYPFPLVNFKRVIKTQGEKTMAIYVLSFSSKHGYWEYFYSDFPMALKEAKRIAEENAVPKVLTNVWEGGGIRINVRSELLNQRATLTD